MTMIWTIGLLDFSSSCKNRHLQIYTISPAFILEITSFFPTHNEQDKANFEQQNYIWVWLCSLLLLFWLIVPLVIYLLAIVCVCGFCQSHGWTRLEVEPTEQRKRRKKNMMRHTHKRESSFFHCALLKCRIFLRTQKMLMNKWSKKSSCVHASLAWDMINYPVDGYSGQHARREQHQRHQHRQDTHDIPWLWMAYGRNPGTQMLCLLLNTRHVYASIFNDVLVEFYLATTMTICLRCACMPKSVCVFACVCPCDNIYCVPFRSACARCDNLDVCTFQCKKNAWWWSSDLYEKSFIICDIINYMLLLYVCSFGEMYRFSRQRL